MSLAAAWALVGLAALPLLVWLHRRRRRAVEVVVPSLLFLEGEPAQAEAPERVRVDRELLLALAAATCLVLAAAGPRVALGGPDVVVRVVTDTSDRMRAKPGGGASLAERAEWAWDAIREHVRPIGRLDTVSARGSDSALLAAARAGEASLRVIVTDHLLEPAPPDVRVVAVGAPDARNLGIVAVDVVPEAEGLRVFANVWNDSARVETGTVVLMDVDDVPERRLAERTLSIPPFSARSVVFGPVTAEGRLAVGFRTTPNDDLITDDAVAFSRDPIRVGVATGAEAYPEPHRRAVLEGLRAVLGADLLVRDDEKPDLWVGPFARAPRSTSLALSLRPLPPGIPGLRPPPGSAFDTGDAAVGKDLDPPGCDLVYAPEPGLRPPYPIVRSVGVQAGRAGYEFVPDPLAGTPPPVDHPIWPIFLENLVATRFGRPGPAGYRVLASVDPLGLASTRIGRDVAPFHAGWLRDASPVRPARERALRPWLAVASIALLAWLWLGRRGRPRDAGRALPSSLLLASGGRAR